MTHSGGKPHPVGDKGQRYEVRFKDGDGVECVYGWTDHLSSAATIVLSIKKHPSWSSPQIVDRQA